MTQSRPRFRPWFRAAVPAAAIVLAGACATRGGPAADLAPERLQGDGLAQPVEIAIDRWGVPHVYARSRRDAFYAQGFMAARDRLWQIDLWRKRGLGRLAKDLGPDYAEGDLMARAVLYRGDAAGEWRAYGDGAQAAAEAFVAGVNAYVALTEREPERLPPEFRLLGYAPARWQAEDIVRIRHHGLTLNLGGEIDRAALYCALGDEAERADWLRRALDPPLPAQPPAGLDPCAIPAEPLKRAYALATAPVRFSQAAAQARGGGTGWETPYAAHDANGDAERGLGSNNWVIGGTATASGRPILANDPHRGHGAPSLRYLIHLSAPGLDAIGAGEPFLPGISIGHNGRIGFGLTRFYIDQEDLYAYETDPRRPDHYRYRGGWEPMRRVEEIIEVKGEPPRRRELRFTRHGPLLHADPDRHRAWSLRAAWLEPGMAPYFGSINYMDATDWHQFRAAMRHWGAPGENQVYADREGNIGWVPGGMMPVRRNWDGLLPVPGDGRYEWDGFRDGNELPASLNPPGSVIVTANENTVPAEHPAREFVGREWSDPARAQRLHALAADRARPHRLQDSAAWQNDTVSMPARRLVALLRDLPAPREPRLAQALALLQGWDGDVRADSAAAVLFEIWFGRHLRPATVAAVLSPDAARRVGAGDIERVLQVLEGRQPWLDAAQRERVLLDSLRTAREETGRRLGDDPPAWRWGDLHVADFRHPLDPILSAAERAHWNVGRWPLGGSTSTLASASYAENFRLVAGASFRMILDVGNWDASLAINTPGQSGDPASPHYRDLAPLWADGGYFPLLYSREAVQRETVRRIELTPMR